MVLVLTTGELWSMIWSKLDDPFTKLSFCIIGCFSVLRRLLIAAVGCCRLGVQQSEARSSTSLFHIRLFE